MSSCNVSGAYKPGNGWIEQSKRQSGVAADKPDSGQVRPGDKYRKLSEILCNDEVLVAWETAAPVDGAWDEFLQEESGGRFQQSSMWARTKAVQGWQTFRVVVTSRRKRVSGFQILWKKFWWGRIGYVEKGPVISPEYKDTAIQIADLLQTQVRRLRLRALIVQPPISCPEMADILASKKFLPLLPGKVNSATWVVDLEDGPDAVEARMSREIRSKARRSAREGVTERIGARDDLTDFFTLMCSSSRHQGVAPNPPNVEFLESMWDAFSPTGNIQLSFTEYKGKVLSGYLDVIFGGRVIKWKIGVQYDAERPAHNAFLPHKQILSAAQDGYACCDFGAFDRKLAISLLQGMRPSQSQIPGRYRFLTRFGGRPVLLPIAQVYLPNPLARLTYRLLFRKQLRETQTESLRPCLVKS